MAITGIDVSRHQGAVDFAAVRRAGHTFAVLKCTDDTSYAHIDWFHREFPKARASGLIPGAYHFLSNDHDGAAQARYYVAEVAKQGGFAGVLAALDVEVDFDKSWPSITQVRQFVAEFRRLVPGHPIFIYTGNWFWKASVYLNNPHGADLGPLWHSEYEVTQAEVADGPEQWHYGGWPIWTMWQWTSSGSCPGVAGNCDLNIFNGDLGQLRANAGFPAPVPPGPVPQPDPTEVEMLVVTRIEKGSAFVWNLPGRVLIGLKSSDDRERLQATGVETWPVSEAQFSALTNANQVVHA